MSRRVDDGLRFPHLACVIAHLSNGAHFGSYRIHDRKQLRVNISRYHMMCQTSENERKSGGICPKDNPQVRDTWGILASPVNVPLSPDLRTTNSLGPTRGGHENLVHAGTIECGGCGNLPSCPLASQAAKAVDSVHLAPRLAAQLTQVWEQSRPPPPNQASSVDFSAQLSTELGLRRCLLLFSRNSPKGQLLDHTIDVAFLQVKRVVH